MVRITQYVLPFLYHLTSKGWVSQRLPSTEMLSHLEIRVKQNFQLLPNWLLSALKVISKPKQIGKKVKQLYTCKSTNHDEMHQFS